MAKNIKQVVEESKKRNKENNELLQKLREAKSIDGIETGNIDALVMADKKELKVYTEKTADKTYRILIEKMHEGAVALNKDGTILYCNYYFANMVNLPLQKVIGTEFKNFIDDSSNKRFVSLLKQGRKKAIKDEVYLHSNDGKAIPVLMSVNTFLLDDSFVSSIILTDLTIQNKNQEELRRANDDLLHLNQNLEKRVSERTIELENLNHELKELNVSKDKFLSLISHDLRNPFAALLVSSDLLKIQTENPGFEKIQPLVKIIGSTSRNILQQLNELLNWAKARQEKIILNPEKLQLVNRVDQSLELLKDIAKQKNIVLKNKVPFDIYVNADNVMLRSILQNLVTNAIKYTPQGGLITIIAQRMNNTVEVCVTDSGIGMKPGIMKNLFTNSNSASLSGTNNEKGTGVGLILVKDFVMQHGGTIHVESKLKKGTSIIFTMPGY